MSVNHGVVWWSELMARDVAGAVDYYGALCGWSFETMRLEDGDDYMVAVAHGRPVAGIMDIGRAPEFGDTPGWFTYLSVDDVAAALEQTVAAGGEIVRPPFDVPQVGRIAIVRDPYGALVGLMTPVFPSDALVDQDEDFAVGGEEENFPV